MNNWLHWKKGFQNHSGVCGNLGPHTLHSSRRYFGYFSIPSSLQMNSVRAASAQCYAMLGLPAAFRGPERKLLSLELGSSVIMSKEQIYKSAPHSLLCSRKKKKDRISQWLPGQKELLAAEHLWKNALLRSVNENTIFLKNWIQLGTINTWKFGPHCFWNTWALNEQNQKWLFKSLLPSSSPYSQVALKILAVLMSSILLKPGKKKDTFHLTECSGFL